MATDMCPIIPIANYKSGTKVWVPHPDLLWIGGILIDNFSIDSRQIRIHLDDDTNVVLNIKSLEQLPLLQNPDVFVERNDLTCLPFLHEPAILHILNYRFEEKKHIYTYCGMVLVSVNPYAECSHLYGDNVIQIYREAGNSVRELKPHIFAVAEEAYFNMKEFSKPQSIVVSGESGAGKTVATKFVMRYLASVAANRGLHEEPTGIEQSVLVSNPIMESIGNAKTVRNDNSSRFGKYVQMNFCDSGSKIAGAEIKTYLLEKSRVVVQASGERNYHVFYQMCAARNHSVLEDLHLGGDSRISGVDDKVNFEALLNALTTLGFSHQQSADVFRVFAGILMLGNVHFESGEASSAVSTSSANDIARLCSELWQIDENALRIWLTRREIRAVNEVVTKALTKNEAVRSRDALAKMLYSQLFNHLVDRINDALDDKEKVSNGIFNERFIGVLDIYGFETFEVNSFEQFCINYANEKLQHLFNQHVFKKEQEECEQENIQWVRVKFDDNQPVVDLIEGPVGLIDLLNEQCKRLDGSDVDWLGQISNSSKLKTNPRLAFSRGQSNGFVIRHFAADVAYTTKDFVEKNRDAIVEKLVNVVASSGFEFMRSVIGSALERSKNSNLMVGKKHVKKTAASKFRDSLKELINLLECSRPHFVKCIKPNNEKLSFHFDAKRGAEQLKACGVLESIRITTAGFPSRLSYEEFACRYRLLCTKENDVWKDTPKKRATFVCQLFLEEGKFALGETMLFLRMGQIAILERTRQETLAVAAVTIQKKWKGVMARKKYGNMKNAMHRAAIVLQKAMRIFIARRISEKIQNSVAQAQSKRMTEGDNPIGRAASSTDVGSEVSEEQETTIEPDLRYSKEKCERGFLLPMRQLLQQATSGLFLRKRVVIPRSFYTLIQNQVNTEAAFSVIKAAIDTNRFSLNEVVYRAAQSNLTTKHRMKKNLSD